MEIHKLRIFCNLYYIEILNRLNNEVKSEIFKREKEVERCF